MTKLEELARNTAVRRGKAAALAEEHLVGNGIHPVTAKERMNTMPTEFNCCPQRETMNAANT